MDIIGRFRTLIKFASYPGELTVKHVTALLAKIERKLGHGLDFIDGIDLTKLKPKELRKVFHALFAFWMTTYGLDEDQLKVSAQLLEAELRSKLWFLKVYSADPHISDETGLGPPTS